MKLMKRITLVGIVVAILAGCGAWNELSVDEVNAALTAAGNEIFGGAQAQPTTASGSVAGRNVSATYTVTVDGSVSGSASFSYNLSLNPLSYDGTTTFSEFAFADDAGDVYTIDGSTELALAVTPSDDSLFTSSYVGEVSVSKNGGSAAVYTVDVSNTVTIEAQGGTVVMTIVQSGTINGQTVSGEQQFTYTQS